MSKKYHDVTWDLFSAIEKEFNSLEESGYLTPENGDMEIAIGVHAAIRNIVDAVTRIMEPEEYILVDKKFYKKSELREPELLTTNTLQGEEGRS